MRRTPVLFALLLALPAAAQASDQRISGWPGGEAQVMSFSPGGAIPIGKIAADGTVTLALPEAPGWNLLRFSITSLHADPTGRNHPRLTEVVALSAAPEDAQWFFQAN